MRKPFTVLPLVVPLLLTLGAGAAFAGSLLQGTTNWTLPNDGGVVQGTFTLVIDDLDAGTPLVDAGTPDAGTPDAGKPDAGAQRIMPLGDSITMGYTTPDGYRITLWQKTQTAGMSIDFVGSVNSGSTGLPDRDHEGHPGLRVDQIDTAVAGYLAAANPDVILLLAGTNDIFQGDTAAVVVMRLETLAKHIAAAAPRARLIIGSIPPQRTPARAVVDPYNTAAAALVTRLQSTQNIQYADISKGLTLDYADIDADNLHPTATSYIKMGTAWFTALNVRSTAHRPRTARARTARTR